MSLTPLKKAIALFLAYCLWVWVFRLISLTLLTYFFQSSDGRFQELSEAYFSSGIVIYAGATLFFILGLRSLHPITSTTTEEIFTAYRFEKRFFPGVFWGALLALSLVLVFIFLGFYRYLGSPVSAEEVPLWLGSVGLRAGSLLVLVYGEEFLFRHKILNSFRAQFGDLISIIATSVLFCALKLFQFDLGWIQALGVFLYSLVVSRLSLGEGDFSKGAGHFFGLLLTFHPLLSLPIFGNEFQGLLLVRYEVPTDFIFEGELSVGRLIAGGVGGPLSSLLLQGVWVLWLGIFLGKKLLLSRKSKR